LPAKGAAVRETTQVSAVISRSTKDLLDRYVEESGMKKTRVIEDALSYHLRALDEIPAEFMIPPRVVLTRESAEHVLRELESTAEPTPALRALLKADDQ
jgi:uncharacterized protein (DUF1778 family)